MSGDEHDAPDDRRRAERAPVNAEFEALSSTTFISDLSELGLFIQTRRRVPIGAVLDLAFTVLLDDPIVLRGRGRVVRHQSEPPGMGIEFVQISPELLLRIHDVVSRQRPRELGPPIGAIDPDDEVTVHRAPIPYLPEPDPEIELQQTGIYPSIRIQIHDPDEPGDPLQAELEGRGGGAPAGPGASHQTVSLTATDVEIVDDDDFEGDDHER